MNHDKLSRTLLKDVGFSLLNEGKTLRIKADGFSMYPTIKPGSVIFIEPVENPAEIKRGDIIAWKKDSGFVVHRLISIFEKAERKYFITRGDSSPVSDDPQPLAHLAGRVVRVESSGGKAIREKSYLYKNPNYLLNRLTVRIILQIRRLKRIVHHT